MERRREREKRKGEETEIYNISNMKETKEEGYSLIGKEGEREGERGEGRMRQRGEKGREREGGGSIKYNDTG